MSEDEKRQVVLDLEERWPFPRFKEADHWMRKRVPIDHDEEREGWGGDA